MELFTPVKLANQHNEKQPSISDGCFLLPEVGFEPRLWNVRPVSGARGAKNPTAASGGCREDFLAQRSTRVRRHRPPKVEPGTARGSGPALLQWQPESILAPPPQPLKER